MHEVIEGIFKLLNIFNTNIVFKCIIIKKISWTSLSRISALGVNGGALASSLSLKEI